MTTAGKRKRREAEGKSATFRVAPTYCSGVQWIGVLPGGRLRVIELTHVVERFDLIIFDCDGVLVDSEPITNAVFRDMLVELGASVTLEEVLDRFVGHDLQYCLRIAAELVGQRLPDGFVDEYRDRRNRALAERVKPVQGIEAVLDSLDCATCVASSGEIDKVRTTLGATGLLPRFEGRLYTVARVKNPKPAPDIFLYAAAQMGVDPSRVAVVEDTPTGVAAGRAAEMVVFGYAERTPAHRLRDAGASAVFASMAELPPLLSGV